MPEPVARGAVVACRQSVGVVWAVAGAEVTILPIGRASVPASRADVPIADISDLAAAGLAAPELVIHCGLPVTAPLAAQRQIGELSGRLACLVSQAVVRAAVEAAHAARWSGDTRHRARGHANLPGAL